MNEDYFPALASDDELQAGMEDLLRALEIIYYDYVTEQRVDKVGLEMNRTQLVISLSRYFASLYEDPDRNADLPDWIRQCDHGIRRIAGRLRDSHNMTPGDARNYFEGAATMLAVAVEQIRQWKHHK
jgi:hypothetical protein